MKNVFTLVIVFFTLSVFAQKAAKPEVYAKTITASDLKKQLYIVASADMQGRETATEGQRKAAAYIESQFKSIGLLPGNDDSYQMFYNIYQDSLTDAKLEVNGQSFEINKDFNPSINNVQATLRFSEIVFVGSNALDSLRNANVIGKAVIVVGSLPVGFSLGQNSSGISQMLTSKGVAAILFIRNGFPENSASIRKGSQYLGAFKKAISPQQFTVSENVARKILGEDYDNARSNTSLIKTYPAEVLLDVRKTEIAAQASNVIGILPGTDLKDEYLVISAHYDHLGMRDGAIYYGADDDGSGTVSVLQVAQAFAKAKADGKGPRR